jgi:serine/threonine-protein phosphatase 2B regulatory subunit
MAAVTAKEVQALWELFVTVSASVEDDGKMSREEVPPRPLRVNKLTFCQFVQALGLRGSTFGVDRLFSFFDRNGDGLVDFESFATTLSVFSPRADPGDKIKSNALFFRR